MQRTRERTYPVLLGCLIFLCLILIGGMVLTASVPPVSRDALTHHLALPKLYIKHGGLIELPDIPFSYYPMNLDLLYLAALYFGNDIIPKYIHMLFGLLTAWLLYRYLRERTGAVFGVTGALLWLSTPIVFRLASEVYVDLGVAFFGAASLTMILRWINSEFKPRYLLWSAVWCGLALGTKYNALLLLAILSLMVPFLRSRLSPASICPPEEAGNTSDGNRRVCTSDSSRNPVLGPVSSAVCFTGIALVVFSPWMIRNTVLKQNPFYPMFKQVFNSDQSANDEWSRTSTMVQDISGTIAVRHLVFNESLGYIAFMPLRIFYEGRDDSPRHFDGKLNPFLLIFSVAGFLPLGALSADIRREQWIWCWFSVLFILMAFFTAPIRIRYILPALPAIVALSMIGIWRIWCFSRQIRTLILKRALTSALIVLVTGMFGYNAMYMVERFQKIQPFTYLRGEISRDAYISERRQEFPLIKYTNENLPSDSVLLGLFIGQRRYYFDHKIIFNEGLLLKALNDAKNPGEIWQQLRRQEITYLFVRLDLYANWLKRNLNESNALFYKQFWETHVRNIREANGFALYALVD